MQPRDEQTVKQANLRGEGYNNNMAAHGGNAIREEDCSRAMPAPPREEARAERRGQAERPLLSKVGSRAGRGRLRLDKTPKGIVRPRGQGAVQQQPNINRHQAEKRANGEIDAAGDNQDADAQRRDAVVAQPFREGLMILQRGAGLNEPIRTE